MKPTKTMKQFKDDDIFPNIQFFGDQSARMEGAARYEIFKHTCHDWYDNRLVNDDDMFPTYFKRNIVKYWYQYDQLCRVQPEVIGTTYDWLVEDYTAAITSIKGSLKNSGQDTTHSTGETTNFSNGTTNGYSEDTHEDNHTGSDTQTRTPNLTTDTTVTKEGSEKTSKSGNDTDTSTYGKTTTKTGDEVHSYGANGIVDTRAIEGSYIEHTHHDTSDNTNNDETTTTSGHTDHKDAAKAMPMTQNGGITQNAAGGDGVDSFTVHFNNAPSNIGESNDHSHESVTVKGGPKVTHSGNEATEHRYGMHLDADGHTVQDVPNDNYKETNTKKGQETTTYDAVKDTEGGKDSVQHDYNSASTLEFKDRSDKTITKETGTDENKTDYASGTNGSSSGHTSQTTENNGGGTNENTVTATKGTAQDTTNETKAESNGRHRAPAEILENAVTYIESTNAWAWMQDKLEPCFFGIWEL